MYMTGYCLSGLMRRCLDALVGVDERLDEYMHAYHEEIEIGMCV